MFTGLRPFEKVFFFFYRDFEPTISRPRHKATTPTTLQSPQQQPPFNHLRHYASFQTPSSTDHATTLSASKRVRERGRKEQEGTPMVHGFLPPFFSAVGVTGRARRLTHDWWIRGVRHWEWVTPPFSKLPAGAGSRAER